MKIGIYNIFTTFWFLTMLLCSGTLTYASFNKDLYSGDVIFIVKIVITIMSLVFICILLYLLYKFRILIINKNNIISIHPFILKVNRIDITKTKNVKWKNFPAFKGTIYRKAEIKQGKYKIDISDFEFENFESLVSSLNGNTSKYKIAIEQAKSNNSMMIFNIILLFGFLVFLTINTIWNNINNLELLFFFMNIVLLFASIKRVFNYRKVLKSSEN